MPIDKISRISLHQSPLDHYRATLVAGPLRIRCAIGRSGWRAEAMKMEGDGYTPRGRYRMVRVFYRPDRMLRPKTDLPITELRRHDGWCDAVGRQAYNRKVRLPFSGSHEQMWRQDHLYDLVVEISHNMRPRVQGRGSAVFLHLARGDFGATEGCIAVEIRKMRLLLERVAKDAVLVTA